MIYTAIDFIFDQIVSIWGVISNTWIYSLPILFSVLTLVVGLIKQSRGE